MSYKGWYEQEFSRFTWFIFGLIGGFFGLYSFGWVLVDFEVMTNNQALLFCGFAGFILGLYLAFEKKE